MGLVTNEGDVVVAQGDIIVIAEKGIVVVARVVAEVEKSVIVATRSFSLFLFLIPMLLLLLLMALLRILHQAHGFCFCCGLLHLSLVESEHALCGGFFLVEELQLGPVSFFGSLFVQTLDPHSLSIGDGKLSSEHLGGLCSYGLGEVRGPGGDDSPKQQPGILRVSWGASPESGQVVGGGNGAGKHFVGDPDHLADDEGGDGRSRSIGGGNPGVSSPTVLESRKASLCADVFGGNGRILAEVLVKLSSMAFDRGEQGSRSARGSLWASSGGGRDGVVDEGRHDIGGGGGGMGICINEVLHCWQY